MRVYSSGRRMARPLHGGVTELAVLRLYVWRGNSISAAYHDDSTLVVLAASPEHAREVAREERDARNAAYTAWEKQRDAAVEAFRTGDEQIRAMESFWARTDLMRQILALAERRGTAETHTSVPV